MAIDRFVQWTDIKPDKEQVLVALETFFDGRGTIYWRDDRFYVDFGEDRWTEVFLSENNMDIITRLQEPPMNEMAFKLAKFIAERFNGYLEC